MYIYFCIIKNKYIKINTYKLGYAEINTYISVTKGGKNTPKNTKTMKIAVIGSRTATAKHYEELTARLETLNATEIISGGADGADALAERYALETGTKLTTYLPDWNKYGKAAGPMRNQDIINAAEIVVALWDGVSRGTADSLKKAKAQRKKVGIIWI